MLVDQPVLKSYLAQLKVRLLAGSTLARARAHDRQHQRQAVGC